MKNSEFENDGAPASGQLRLTPLEEAAGATCNVYTGRLFGKKVFVKEIKPEYAADARMLAAFRKEAEIGFRLDHRNLPQYIYAEGVLPSGRYIVQEFIDGRTLPDFIRENPAYFRNGKNLERFIREFSDVIDYLHSNRVVHLDLKPENIMISRVGSSLRLVDLGFCASDCYDDTRGFTPGELAPEGSVAPGERGFESDYFGFGKILTYIRANTPGVPGGRFRKLERLLLLPDPSRRLTSKEGIGKILGRSAWKRMLPVAAVAVAAVLAIVLLFAPGHSPGGQGSPGGEAAGIRASEDVGNAAPVVAGHESVPSERSAAPTSAENRAPATDAERAGAAPAPQAREAQTADPGDFPYQTYEKLKAEMRENISRNFADFSKMVNTYLCEGRFSEQDNEAVTDTYRAALRKTFDTAPYKAKYGELSADLIDDTIVILEEEVGRKDWVLAFKRYVREYQASLSGTSR